MRASYILPILKRFPWRKPRKTGGGLSPPRKKPKQKPLCIFEFWVDPLNWQSFIEIGEMACSTTTRCFRGHTLNQSDTKLEPVLVWTLGFPRVLCSLLVFTLSSNWLIGLWWCRLSLRLAFVITLVWVFRNSCETAFYYCYYYDFYNYHHYCDDGDVGYCYYLLASFFTFNAFLSR